MAKCRSKRSIGVPGSSMSPFVPIVTAIILSRLRQNSSRPFFASVRCRSACGGSRSACVRCKPASRRCRSASIKCRTSWVLSASKKICNENAVSSVLSVGRRSHALIRGFSFCKLYVFKSSADRAISTGQPFSRRGKAGPVLQCLVVSWLGLLLLAQWLNYPTPGIPRLSDGKPNLSAPAPRGVNGKPDLSGIWVVDCGIYGGDRCFVQSLFFDLAKDLKPEEVQMTAWAAAIQAQREKREHVDDPYG